MRIKHSFTLNLHPVSLSLSCSISHTRVLSSLMMFNFLWHARTTCVRILKLFVGLDCDYFFCDRCKCSSNPCRGAGSKHCLIVGSLGKTPLLFIMSHKTCGLFLYSEKERDRGCGGQRESKMRSCFLLLSSCVCGEKMSICAWISRVGDIIVFV